MPQNPLIKHPLFIRMQELQQLRNQTMADGLATAIRKQDPQLIELTEYVIGHSGLDLKEVAKRIGTGHVLLLRRLKGHATVAKDPALAIKFADTVITMLAEQLPHPPEGL